MASKAKSTKEVNALVSQVRAITGASTADATRLLKKYTYSLERAIDGFYTDGSSQSSVSTITSSDKKEKEKKLGDIWEQYKDPNNPGLITIEGTLQLCEDLEIDPESDPVLFCLAADLGSKTVGEWSKDSWIKGWRAINSSIDSLSKMKNQLPSIRSNLNTDPDYFKKVYKHVFDLSKAPAARTLVLDQALSFWQVLIPPALASNPSALSHVIIIDSDSGEQIIAPDPTPQFTQHHLDIWIEFQKSKGKAISRDTWDMFLDFVRVIDKDFKDYDEEGPWPSTIDEFVSIVREKLGKA